MPRRIKPKETKRDWRWWTSMLLNGAVVVSMVFGSILVFAGVPTASTQPLPTLEAPTVAPPTGVPPATPTPKAGIDVSAFVQVDWLAIET
ncbi:MAG: hypothetical protein L0Y55_13855 [Anaerolineales bacterium]|nr:hypothetical protein [Anaerolineales bacterium]